MPIQNYIEKISQRYKDGDTTELTYRGDLQNLLENLLPNVSVIHEPKQIKCGKPDYIIKRDGLDVGWIETKAIGKQLDSKQHQEQFGRYLSALHNMIITDYLQFDFYRLGEKVTRISLATLEGKKIQALPENFAQLTGLLKDFASYAGQTITSATFLSKMMAGKARLLADVIEKALNSDEENQADSSLKEQMKAFKDVLLHEITIAEFADIYAQTIAYGMFAARLHDENPQNFSRLKAADTIPLSNPFLRKLFQYIAGFDLDERIVWIVNPLADIFRLADVKKIMQTFGNGTQQTDPVIHFYETFLAEYDPKLRKSRGVWYTPEPIVNFIVRAVDDILKTEFNLNDGLADTSKTTIEVDAPLLEGNGKNRATAVKKLKKEVHKVQILDPATGTGTFLAAIIKHIYQNQFQTVQQGVWSSYVENHLIPRLNGFEILMASYAMAHLKMDLLLTETEYKPKKQKRFNIYLTNSLEKEHPDTGTLFTFARWLSDEANEANYIKRDTPVMVVMGNPPYAVSSSNKNDWIQDLISVYKKDLNEKNIQPLSDDYIKFIRYGSHFIEKNGAGILAYISNNSFIDGVIHRQMRKHLLETFDSIYILDLHGSNKKKETAFDGSKDENVFDIMQGVSINIFVKKPNLAGLKDLPGLASVYQFDLYGSRKHKYETLLKNDLKSLAWNKIDCRAPEYFFIAKDFKVQKSYSEGFSVADLFPVNSSGIQTKRDKLFVDFDKEKLEQRMELLLSGEYNYKFTNDYNIQDSSSYSLKRKILACKYSEQHIIKLNYRPFDTRYIYYDKELLGRPFYNVMQHFFKEGNVSLISCRQQSTFDFQHIFVSRLIADMCCISAQTKETGYIYPLYLYPENIAQQITTESSKRIPNLDTTLVKKIAKRLGLKFTNEKETKPNTFAPIDLLDYIYAVLHSPTYRETYKDFLKTDFPRVPYPEIESFWQLVNLGSELRQLHLLESSELETKKLVTIYPIEGNDCITRKLNKNDFELTDSEKKLGRVWINDSQYFDKVPLVAWEFYIGGYQPAQKWLKDRQGQVLSFEDILHYQKMIKALAETAWIMQKIDLTEV